MFNFTRVFKVSQNCPSRAATRVICETLKTQVKLTLILRGPVRLHINSIEGKIYSNIITLYAASPLEEAIKCQSQTTNLQYNKTLFMSIITQILLKNNA